MRLALASSLRNYAALKEAGVAAIFGVDTNITFRREQDIEALSGAARGGLAIPSCGEARPRALFRQRWDLRRSL